ncbi:MAG: hypothetical protein MHMPM18_000952 [Marteilia pararefringens]
MDSDQYLSNSKPRLTETRKDPSAVRKWVTNMEKEHDRLFAIYYIFKSQLRQNKIIFYCKKICRLVRKLRSSLQLNNFYSNKSSDQLVKEIDEFCIKAAKILLMMLSTGHLVPMVLSTLAIISTINGLVQKCKSVETI